MIATTAHSDEGGTLAEGSSDPASIGFRSQFTGLMLLELSLARRRLTLTMVLLFVPVVLTAFMRPGMNLLVSLVESGSTKRGLEFTTPGLLVLLCFVNLQFFGWNVYDEHGFGTWDRLRSGYTAPSALLAAKALFMTGYLVLMFAITFVANTAMGMRPNGSLLAWGVTAILTSAVASIYGLMLYVLLPTSNLYTIVSQAGSVILGGFGGALVPSRYLPSWIREIATYLPQRWSVQAFHDVSFDRGSLISIAPDLLVLVCFGVAFASIAAWRFDPSASKRPPSE